MGFLSKVAGVLTSTASKTLLLNGIAVPVVATIVGFEVQKKLIKREQKRMQLEMAKQASQNTEADSEEITEDELPD